MAGLRRLRHSLRVMAAGVAVWGACTANVRRGVGGGVRRPLANGGAWAAWCGRCVGAAWLGRGPVDVAHRD
jgi:hypothetical protein